MATAFKRGSDKRRKDSSYTIKFYDHVSKSWRMRKGYPDYDASLQLAIRLEKESSRRAEGLIDAFDDAMKAPIAVAVEEYIASVKALGRSERYLQQLSARINAVIAGTSATRLHELDTVKIEKYLARQGEGKGGIGGITRAEYITSIKGLTRWAFQNRKLPHDPLANLKRPSRRAIEPKHLRRAISPEEAARLLDAALRRPLLEMQTVRTGKNKGKLIAKVSDRVKAKAARMGAGRRLAYLIAFFTGLRRGELRALQWGDIVLDSKPARIQLRANTTKSKRADSLPLHPQLAEELLAARPANVTPSARVLRTVPDMKAFKADLELAGIAYETEHGFADFHALRVSSSTMLASCGVSPRSQQALMRHTDPRTTSKIYTDEKLLPLAAEWGKVPSLPDVVTPPPEAIPLKATGTDAEALAPLMHHERGLLGQRKARMGNDDPETEKRRQLLNCLRKTLKIQGFGTKKESSAPSGTELLSKRAKGVEPSTFTLAT